MRRRILLFLCVFFVCLASPGRIAAQAFSYPDTAHGDVPADLFADYTVSADGIRALCGEMDALAEGGSAEEIQAKYREMNAEMDHILTQYSKIQVLTSRDVTDRDLAAAEEEAYNVLYDAYDLYFASLQNILNGENAAALTDILTEDEAEAVREYEFPTEEQKQLTIDELAVTDRYYQAMEEEFSVEVGGRTYTMEDLENDTIGDRETYFAVLNGIERAQNEAAAPIYKELVDLCVREAELAGYDNYREYAYEEIYMRDYSEEDIRTLEDYTKQYLAPLFDEASYIVYDEEPAGATPFDGKDLDGILDTLEPLIEKTVPEMKEAWDYMRRNSLVESESGPGRADGAFTVSMPEYHAGYIYDDAYGSYWDFKTLIHEFGHFNAAYHDPTPGVFMADTIDVAEVQSQGFEVLFIPNWTDMAGDAELGAYYGRNVLLDMIGSVVTGCMYNECEEYAFAHPDESIDEWNRAFGEIYASYGLDYYTDNGIAYEWVNVGHFFESPLYYISYATSAIAALDLYAEAEEDRDAAVEKYLSVSAAGNLSFTEMLDECGLRDVFDSNTIRSIAYHLAESFEIDPAAFYGEEDESAPAWDDETDGGRADENDGAAGEDAEDEQITDDGSAEQPDVIFENEGEWETEMENSAMTAVAAAIGIFGLVYLLIIIVMVLILEKKRKNRRM